MYRSILSLVLALALFHTAPVLADTSPKCPGEEGYHFINYKNRNPKKGGFVANSADVSDSEYVFIAPTAAVCESASVRDQARIYGNAVVRGSAEISGEAKVYGNAVVEGDAVVTDNARVYDRAEIGGSSYISGSARIKGWTKLDGEDISSGVHNAPQFSQAELARMRQEELLRKQREEARIERERQERRLRQQREEEERLLRERKEEDAKQLDRKRVEIRSQLARLLRGGEIIVNSKHEEEGDIILNKARKPCRLDFDFEFIEETYYQIIHIPEALIDLDRNPIVEKGISRGRPYVKIQDDKDKVWIVFGNRNARDSFVEKVNEFIYACR